jgi:FMN phosphatase YigB (HAD superfamily)
MITFDVWDTLLRRKCHPDAIKIFATHKFMLENMPSESFLKPIEILRERRRIEAIVSQKNVSNGYDDEYPINQVYKAFGASDPQKYLEYELELELKHSYASKKIKKYLERYKNKDLGYISDFYFGEPELSRIVQRHFPGVDWKVRVSSSDYLLNKRSGRLFKELTKMGDWVHIGDNAFSDVIQARKAGIKPILYRPWSESLFRNHITRLFNKRMKNLSKFSKIDMDLALAIGLVGMTSLIRSKKTSENTICFCEREGIFLKKVFDLTNEKDPYGLASCESTLLSVSRLSTFAAAFHSRPIDSLHRIYSQYSEISLSGLCKSLKLSIDDFPTKMENLAGKDLMTSIISDDELLESLRQKTTHSYESALSYLNSKHLKKNLLLVDIGWSGSIQANIAAILSEAHIVEGHYLAKRLNSWSHLNMSAMFENHEFTKSYKKIMRAVRPLELLFGSKEGSVVSYKTSGDVIKIVRSEGKDFPPESFLALQNDILARIPDAVTFIQKNLLTIEETSRYLLFGCDNLVSKPPRNLVRGYLQSEFDETFGLGRRFLPRLPRVGIKAAIQKDPRKVLKEFYWRVGWPEAIFFKLLHFVPPKFIVEKLGDLFWQRGRIFNLLRKLQRVFQKVKN